MTLLLMLLIPPLLTKISGIVSGNFLLGDLADCSTCIVPDLCIVAVLQLLVSHLVLGYSLVVWREQWRVEQDYGSLMVAPGPSTVCLRQEVCSREGS